MSKHNKGKTLSQVQSELEKGGVAVVTETKPAEPVAEVLVVESAPIKAPEPTKVVEAKKPKYVLAELPIGTKDGNQILRAVKANGTIQLWEGKVGFGVVRIVKNRYEVILPCRVKKEIAESTFNSTN